MRKINRWGVLALVVLMVLGTMSSALAAEADPGEEEPAAEVVEPGAELWTWAADMVAFVLYWGVGEPEGDEEAAAAAAEEFCQGTFAGLTAPEGEGSVGDGEDGALVLVDCLDVEGPNGQVNHGTFVSSFVHWLKGDGMEALAAALDGDLPKGKGQLVKMAAQHHFGKGFDTLGADGDEDGGPPPWAKNKSAKVKGPKNR